MRQREPAVTVAAGDVVGADPIQTGADRIDQWRKGTRPDGAQVGLEQIEASQAPSDFWKGVKLLPRRPGQHKVTLDLVNKLRDEEH